ncbi:porphobilinogen deaminase [Plasmodium gonderi]|uniref:hydroxymethylbilane synthase n=1 Tax=Plasmodium gonderi TaxID=77519 RepID=A0A1Y1JK13_PLAGO|nr:porphobilinogen deaminase [Plasmodium gonderi]GAW82829.1 porphobilinogen deaminase [Plasmodium gonderi]
MHILALLLLCTCTSIYVCRNVHLMYNSFVNVHNLGLQGNKNLYMKINLCRYKNCKKKLQHVHVGQEIIIGTRDSPLAIKQSEKVKRKLLAHFKKINKNVNVILKPIKTTGDKILDRNVGLFGGKGIFTKELDDQLIKNNVHICVHSLKDVPMELPEQIHLSCFLIRDTINDVFLSMKYRTLGDINKMKVDNSDNYGNDNTMEEHYKLAQETQELHKADAYTGNYNFDQQDKLSRTIGTSSLRRRSQIKYTYKNITIKQIRGNINTRIAKVYNGDYDSIIIAKCGLERLVTKKAIRNIISRKNRLLKKPIIINYNNTNIDLSLFNIQQINTRTIFPALCQGIIAVSSHKNNKVISDILKNINDDKSEIMANIERSFLYQIEGNCMMPIGGYTKIVKKQIFFNAVINDIQGREKYHVREIGHVHNYDDIAVKAAIKIKEKIGIEKFNKIREEAALYYA